jgi:hypothetical protein
MSLKILFVSANPSMDLNLDEEIRSIQKSIDEHSDKRGTIEFIHKPAVRMSDLISALRQEKPHIVHFSGHGFEGEGELCMIDDETKEEKAIPTRALSALFKNIKKNGHLRLVFLNSCYSKEQAEAIIEHVDYVIGMNDSIGDNTARTLSTRFYATFATGASIEDAFADAEIMIMTNHSDEEDIPKLLKRNESVEDFTLGDIVGDVEENQSGGTTVNIKGDITGGGGVTGGTVHQNISKKTVNAKNNFENVENKDGGVINFK